MAAEDYLAQDWVPEEFEGPEEESVIPIDVTMTTKRTDKAYLFEHNKYKVKIWIPKSVILINIKDEILMKKSFHSKYLENIIEALWKFIQK